jgi:hypothetical protein
VTNNRLKYVGKRGYAREKAVCDRPTVNRRIRVFEKGGKVSVCGGVKSSAPVPSFSGFPPFSIFPPGHMAGGVNLLDLGWKTLYELDFVGSRPAPDGR